MSRTRNPTCSLQHVETQRSASKLWKVGAMLFQVHHQIVTRVFSALRERCPGTRPASFDSWPLELSSFDNVRSFVDRFDAEGPERLNILVANAGTFKPAYTRTQDDWEIMSVRSRATCNSHLLT